MTLERYDAVGESTTTTGTGTVTLSGSAVTGFRTFSAASVTNGATLRYRIQTADNSSWECGQGVYDSGAGTLTRASIYASSNAGAAVDFAAGTKAVIVVMTAADFGSFAASAISFTPAGAIAATDVQAAIQEMDGEKEASANKDASGGYAGLTLFKLNLRNAANTITSFFTTAATVARTWTMPDKDGTVAMTSDITAAAVGLSNLTNDAQTKAAIVPNTAPSAGQFLAGNAGGTAYAPVSMSGDATLASTGAITIANSAVTLAKIANAAASSKLLGSGASGSGAAYAEITLGTNLSMTGTTLNASGGGTPAGSGTEIQYRDGSAFGAMAGTAWDDTNRSLTITGATVTTSKPVLDLSQTWNAGAVAFTGYKFSITETAASNSSKYLDIQVGGVSYLALLKASGALFIYNGFIRSNSGQYWFTNSAGTSNSVFYNNSLINANSSGGFGISAGSDAWDVSDVSLRRDAARVFKITDGGTTNLGDLKLRNLIGTGGMSTGTVAKTSAYTFTLNDHVIEGDATAGALVITLPALSTVNPGQEAILQKIDSSGNAVTFDGNASETINGATTLSTSTQYAVLRIKANAAKTGWISF